MGAQIRHWMLRVGQATVAAGAGSLTPRRWRIQCRTGGAHPVAARGHSSGVDTATGQSPGDEDMGQQLTRCTGTTGNWTFPGALDPAASQVRPAILRRQLSTHRAPPAGVWVGVIAGGRAGVAAFWALSLAAGGPRIPHSGPSPPGERGVAWTLQPARLQSQSPLLMGGGLQGEMVYQRTENRSRLTVVSNLP